MKRQLVLGCAALLGLLGARPAQAQGIDEFGPYGREARDFDSPQNAAVELRIGRYYPRVDEEFAGTGESPFRDSFGRKRRWYAGLEVDWQIFRIPFVGTIGPGVGLGLTNMEGRGFLADGTAADETTTLNILPTYGVGVLRIDPLVRYTPVPLAFYGKAGLGYALWWTKDHTGITEADDGRKGKGSSYGSHFALGVMFLLDSLDRRRARDLDATRGINHSYLFLEWYRSDLNGFDNGHQMQVGSESWTAGIALEM